MGLESASGPFRIRGSCLSRPSSTSKKAEFHPSRKYGDRTTGAHEAAFTYWPYVGESGPALAQILSVVNIASALARGDRHVLHFHQECVPLAKRR